MAKELFSVAAIVLTFAIFVPYIRSIRRGLTKPHVFSCVIWALGTFVVAMAQLAGSGGVGAWPIGLSGLITAYIAVFAYNNQSDTAWSFSDRSCGLRSDVPLRLFPSAWRAHRLLLLGCGAQFSGNLRAGALFDDDRLVPCGRRRRLRRVRRNGRVPAETARAPGSRMTPKARVGPVAPETFELDCIRLPRPTLADADALFAIGCDPEVARYADWLTENLASARALEKAGMQREGTTQCCTDAFIMRGERVVSRYRVDL